jgi:hypothetical protein
MAGAISQCLATKIGSRELPNMNARHFDAWRQRRDKTLPRPAAALTQLSSGRRGERLHLGHSRQGQLEHEAVAT